MRSLRTSNRGSYAPGLAPPDCRVDPGVDRSTPSVCRASAMSRPPAAARMFLRSRRPTTRGRPPPDSFGPPSATARAASRRTARPIARRRGCLLCGSSTVMSTSYRCRLCKSTAYRRVRARADDGTALYRCSGCAVVFNDPQAWREGPAEPPPLAPSARALLGTWGVMPPMYRQHEQSPEELQRIKEAAARANRSKRRR